MSTDKKIDVTKTAQSNALGPSAIKSAIKTLLKAREVPMIWGPPGVGKSDLCFEIGRETNRKVLDIRLALWEPTDVRGIPFYDPESKTMKWAPPSELPQGEKDNPIILFDELPSAAPTVQVGAYQITLNRRIGEYVLPKGADMICAGNRENDRGVTYKMPMPLANRLIHLQMKADFNDWFQWAINNDVHNDVVSFLTWSKKDLFDFDPKSSSMAFATPRSWEKASNILKHVTNESENLVTSLMGGAIGDGLAISFMTYRKLASKLPKTDEILDGSLKKLKNSRDISILYAICINCCSELRERIGQKNWLEQVDNYFQFALDNFMQEMIVVAVKFALRNYELPIDPCKLKTYNAFMEKVEKHLFSN
jgi:hypothetical protein